MKYPFPDVPPIPVQMHSTGKFGVNVAPVCGSPRKAPCSKDVLNFTVSLLSFPTCHIGILCFN